MVLFRHNRPQPTQVQAMRGEFPETLCIEQGVVLSCRFAEWPSDGLLVCFVGSGGLSSRNHGIMLSRILALCS